MPSSSILLMTILCATLATSTSGANFRGGRVTMSTDEVESSLLLELSSSIKLDGERIPALEKVLAPMYRTVPQEADGRLSHSVVRYVLHRFFQQHRGWFIKGLEPAGDARNASLPALKNMQEWVPSYLQGFLEQLMGGRGTSLRELAVFAATLEDLVHKEESSWLEAAYEVLRISTDTLLEGLQVTDVLETYMMIYMLEGNLTAHTPESVYQLRNIFAQKLRNWGETQFWLKNIIADLFPKGPPLNFSDTEKIVQVAGEKYGTLNDIECGRLKAELLSSESKKPGRVRLVDFYKKALDGTWEFNEKIDYLRAIGALDESDPITPLVIVPNYVASRPNCLTTSYFYAVCCRNECEDLLQKLEIEIGEPLADPERIVEFISATPSDTVLAPRNLSESLISRLDGVARSNAGKVPLHGRLFAQWMHHAYPRECPFPHEAGSSSPLTPDEWMQGTGESDSKASEEEMREHLSSDSCRLLPHGMQCGAPGQEDPVLLHRQSLASSDEDLDLPWKDVEELLVTHSGLPMASTQVSDGLPPYYRLVFIAAIMPVAFALAWLSKTDSISKKGLPMTSTQVSDGLSKTHPISKKGKTELLLP